MVQYDLSGRRGFSVIHESAGWRIACHGYEPEVNGIGALREWGIHLDSEEVFVLLQGRGVLAVQDERGQDENGRDERGQDENGRDENGRDENGQVRVTSMEPSRLYVVGAGERHAIALAEGSLVLIMENEDMSRFETAKMEESHRALIGKALEEFSGEFPGE